MSNTILYGRVVRDIEVRYTNQNMAIARFSIAVNRKYKSEDKKADFFNITAFGKKAETLSQYFHQGSRIVVYCHPQQEQKEQAASTMRAMLRPEGEALFNLAAAYSSKSRSA